jgi:hypothetical protein
MGKQVTFFMLREDEQEFANFVLQDRRVVFLPSQFATKQIHVYRNLTEASQPQYPGTLLIWNRGIGGELVMHEYGPGNVRIDKSNEPVIEFCRSFQHGTHLIAGRIWAEMQVFDPSQTQVIHKGKDFERWYDSVARWIRRHYEHETKYGMYIGPQANKQYKSGKLDIAQLLTKPRPV